MYFNFFTKEVNVVHKILLLKYVLLDYKYYIKIDESNELKVFQYRAHTFSCHTSVSHSVLKSGTQTGAVHSYTYYMLY